MSADLARLDGEANGCKWWNHGSGTSKSLGSAPNSRREVTVEHPLGEAS